MYTTAVKLDMTVQYQTVFLIDRDAVKVTLTIDFSSWSKLIWNYKF